MPALNLQHISSKNIFYYKTIVMPLFKKCNIGTLLLSNML